MYGRRVLTDIDRTGGVGENVYVYTEDDYVDKRETYTYDASHFTFKDITDNAKLKQLQQINMLLDLIINKRIVRLQNLRNIVGAVKYEQYEEYLTADLHDCEIRYSNGMPSELKKYNLMLRNADFLTNKYEKMADMERVGLRKYKNGTTTKTYNKSEEAYELALEKLQEIFSMAQGAERAELDFWMDRPIDFEQSTDTTIGIDAVSIPRVRGSKSKNALDSGLPKLSKRLKRELCALYVLLETVCDIAFNIPQPVVQNNAVLIPQQQLKFQNLLRSLNPEKD